MDIKEKILEELEKFYPTRVSDYKNGLLEIEVRPLKGNYGYLQKLRDMESLESTDERNIIVGFSKGILFYDKVEPDITVCEVTKTDKYIIFEWIAGGIGFGQLVIGAELHDIVDDECMSKEFCNKVIKIGMERLANTERLNKEIADLKNADMLNTKDLSDTYHTFDELYNHRMAFNVALTQVINLLGRTDLYAYKSLSHHDGTMFDGMFIVVIESPVGQISYHYDLWNFDKFQIPTLEKALEYDGHTPKDTIERLLKLL